MPNGDYNSDVTSRDPIWELFGKVMLLVFIIIQKI